jgi:hypothetical protein
VVEPLVESPPTIFYDNDVLPIMQEVLGCLCDALIYAPGGVPCACLLVPGANVAMDYCDCTNPAYGCGQAWVRLDQSFAGANVYNSVYARKALQAARCVDVISHRLQIGVTRCTPGMDAQGEPPDQWDQLAAVEQQMGDFAAIRRALDCCFTLNKRREWLFERYTPVGPSGNCVGGFVTMNFRVVSA